MKTNYTVTWIVSILTMLLLVFVIVKNNNTKPEVAPTSVTTTNDQACASQANINFNTINKENTKNDADQKEVRNYRNHFNQTLNKCFMLTISSDKEIGTTLTTLYDVYENKKLAYSLTTTDPTGATNDFCSVSDLPGTGGCAEYEALISKDLEV